MRSKTVLCSLLLAAAALPAHAAAQPATPKEEERAAPGPADAPPPGPEPAPPAATEAPPAELAQAQPVAAKDIGLGIALKALVLVPSGRTTDVAADVSSAGGVFQKASHSATGGGALALSYGLPFAGRIVSIRAEAGVYPLNGKGTRTYPNDPDFGTVSYAYSAIEVPVLLGVAVTLPIPLPVPLRITPEVGFASAWSRIESKWTKDGTTVATSPVTGWALGFYAGLELSWKLGPGALVLEGRYVNARTSLGLDDKNAIPEYGGVYNAHLGDVQGTNVLVGYRLEL
ncbi:MAG TPA: hypothetical protein VGK67_19100 [Myxococcales bacterium]|jgi:hypothetical protein